MLVLSFTKSIVRLLLLMDKVYHPLDLVCVCFRPCRIVEAENETTGVCCSTMLLTTILEALL